MNDTTNNQVGLSRKGIIYFQLYVLDYAPNSSQTVADVRAFCREYFPNRHKLEVIDVLKDPTRASGDGVLITPTLIVSSRSTKKIITDIENKFALLSALGMAAESELTDNSAKKSEVPDHEHIRTLVQQWVDMESIIQKNFPLRSDAIIDTVNQRSIIFPHVQAELNEWMTRFLQLTNQLQAFVFQLSTDGTIRYVNGAVSKVTGYPSYEIIGKNWWKIFFPQEQHQNLEELQRFFQHKSARKEITLTTKGGGKAILDLSLSNEFDPQAGLKNIIGLGIDITKQRRKEEKLSKWADLMKRAEVGFAIGSADQQTIEMINPAFAKMHGYTVEELINTPILELYPPECRAELHKQMLLSHEKGHHAFESKLVRKDGSQFPVVVNITAVKGDNNNVMYYTVQIQDITEQKRAEEEQKKNLEKVYDLYNNAPCGYHSLDNEGTIVEINDTELYWLGYTRGEIVGRKKFSDIVTPRSIKVFEKTFPRFKREGYVKDVEFEMIRKDGTVMPVLLNASLVRDVDGNYVMSRATILDLTERLRQQEKLRQAAIVFENTNEGIMITDPQGDIITINEAFTKITGYKPGEVIGKNPQIFSELQHEDIYAELQASLRRSGQWQGEIWNRRKNGEVYPALENVSVVKDNTGAVVNYIYLVTDISIIKQAEERLSHLAHHDALTGLPNRLLFSANLEQALERAKRNKRRVAVLFLDLDRFKRINDTLGHEFGDRLLQTVAERLKNSIRASDTAARLGGDEFTIILDDITNPRDAAKLAGKIIAAVAQPIDMDGREINTSTSLGISLFPDDAESGEALLKAADNAMYRAKALGRHNYQFYRGVLTTKAFERLSLEKRLQNALEQKQFVLNYQPQITLNGDLAGVEALIRWRHPEMGLLSPDKFLPIAEDMGLIQAIGKWVLRTVCLQAKIWQTAGLPAVRVAVNLSGREISHNHNLVNYVKEALTETGLEPQCLELEIGEKVWQTQNNAIFTDLKSLGISLAVDNFGVGGASISILKELPIDIVKIDQSLVHEIPNDRTISSAIISLTHRLGLKVVGEGVETEDQLNILRSEACDEMQGFLFGKPMSAEGVGKLLQQGGRII